MSEQDLSACGHLSACNAQADAQAERAIARACLEQTALALSEARELRGFWDSLGSDVRMRWCDFQADVHAMQVSLKEPRGDGSVT